MITNLGPLVLAFVTALCISVYANPVIIKVAFIKKLYDKPGGRKGHRRYVPNLGGIAIFAAFFIAFLAWADFSAGTRFQYLIVGLILLHFTGLKDDIVPLVPLKKLGGQLLAAAILVIPGKFRLTDLGGIVGIYHLPVAASVLLSIFAVIVIINAFNLIDGIDGLAGSIGLILSLTFSLAFWQHGRFNMAIASLALAGALAGFLVYNRQPARIFMGDTGSMGIGYLIAAFALLFVHANETAAQQSLFHHNPAVVIAFLIIPLFDTLRVFLVRLAGRHSPFTADRNHIHHKLLDLGLSHGRATVILCTVNILFIGMAYLIKDMNPNWVILIVVGAAGMLTYIPCAMIQYNKKKATETLLQPAFKIVRTPHSKEIPVPSAMSGNEVASKLHLN